MELLIAGIDTSIDYEKINKEKVEQEEKDDAAKEKKDR
jgi:hypothetical protein